MSATGVTASIATRSITVGDGTDYCWGQQGISGLGRPQVRNNDVSLLHQDGDVGQNDYTGPRKIAMELVIGPQPGGGLLTADEVWDAWDALRTAWAPSLTDLTLAVDLFGNSLSFLGRPDEGILDTSPMLKGLRALRVMLTFRCPDPTQY